MGNSALIEVPFDVEKAFGKKRVKVRCLIEGVEFRSSIMRMGVCGPRHVMILNKQIREAIGKDIGDTIYIMMEEDTKPRIVAVPADVKAALAAKAKIKNIFDRLSYSHQREYVNWIDSAKKAETRQTRIGKMIKMLAAGQ
jgi:Bacteriocin-protection, YdeI or OmpD-Associated/Domain of unknown function (DUF1905)